MASLIAHSGALGDFITCLPAMEAWRQLHPDEPLVLLGKPSFAALAPVPGFDEVWDVQSARSASLFGAAFRDTDPAHARLRALTAALVFALPSSPLVRLLAAAGVTEILRQNPFPTTRVHIVDYHLSLFPPGIAARAGRCPRIRHSLADGIPNGTTALHPGSGSPRKNWPFERYVSLAGEIERAGRRVVWILGPAEERVDIGHSARPWRDVELPTLASRLAQCDCYVGNDSGVTHLAAATGCPTVALFGATEPDVWGPRGRAVRIIASRTGDMGSISVVEVVEAWRSICADESNSYGNESFPPGELSR